MSKTKKNGGRTRLNTEATYKLSISTYGYGRGLTIDLLEKEGGALYSMGT